MIKDTKKYKILYKNFLSTIGVTTWNEFKARIIGNPEKYKNFVSLLAQKMDENAITKFISDVMKASKQYS